MKSSSPTKPIFADYIQTAAQVLEGSPREESYDRTSRKDFWNDPERWDGIDDTHKTMIWEVRRPDRIDVGGKATDDNSLRNMPAAAVYDLQNQLYLKQLQTASRLPGASAGMFRTMNSYLNPFIRGY